MTDQKKDVITEAECDETSRLMNMKYGSYAGSRYFEASFDSDNTGVYVKVTLRNQNGSFFYPVEGRLAHEEYDLTKRDAGFLLLDYIDMYFDEYFKEDGGCYLPIDWSDYEYDDVQFQLKGQILNLQVEKMADELLGSSCPS